MLKFVPVIVSGTFVSPGCSTAGVTPAIVGRASRTLKLAGNVKAHPLELVAVTDRVETGAFSATETFACTEMPSIAVTDETVTPGPRSKVVDASRLRPSMVRVAWVFPCFRLDGETPTISGRLGRMSSDRRKSKFSN